MNDNLFGMTSAEMHAEVERRRREDPIAADNARARVEAMDMVNEFVPDANRRPTDPWILQMIKDLSALPVPADYFDRDPFLVAEEDQQMYPLAGPIPARPTHSFCARCQSWEAQFARLEFGAHPTKRVYPVRFARGQRVIEVLMCRECIETLGHEAS